MKRLLLLLPILTLVGGCAKQEPPLPNPGENSKTVKLVKSNSGLTDEISTEAFDIILPIEGKEEGYEIEIGVNCYAHKSYEEFLITKNGYIKSKSKYMVDRLIIDFVNKKGVNFTVENGDGEVVESHTSTIPSEYSGEEDYGYVLEYPINGNAWIIKNTTEYKPAFYSVTVVFTI